jgi:hypothetical protein
MAEKWEDMSQSEKIEYLYKELQRTQAEQSKQKAELDGLEYRVSGLAAEVKEKLNPR